MRGKKNGWWESGFFGLHYDLHAGAQDTVLGAELTREHLREQLLKVKPDFVQCDCKGHPGYTSYPTKVGTPSPGIVHDALRIHRDVTRELGIPLSVHYSGVQDHRAVELHPDWAAIDSKGRYNAPDGAQGVLCRRSPYLTELLIPQMLEIVDTYDVDGFWVDGENWAVTDCYCPRCRAEFTRRTGIVQAPETTDHPDWPAWRAFQSDSFVEYVTTYANAVHARKPDCAVCSNWMYTMRQPGPIRAPVDYISGDFTPSFGCERAEAEARYTDGHRVPWNLMAWTFCRSDEGVPWQIKTVPHLCQEAAEVMSCGGGVFLYNQPQRTGWMTTWHQDLFAEVAKFCRARQPFCQHTRSVPEAVLLLSDPDVQKNNPAPFWPGDTFRRVEGALHALLENQIHTDMLDETRLLERMTEYGLVVIPEQEPVSAAVLSALADYARQGGTVLLTGAHLADLCPELIGVAAVEPMRKDVWHLPVGNEVASVAGPWRPVRVTDAGIYAPVMKEQQVGKDETVYPGVTIRRLGQGKIVAIHGAFMRTYFLSHHPRLRQFLRTLLESLDIDWKCRVTGPAHLEVSLRESEGRLLVQLVNRAVSPTLAGHQHIVETVPPTGRIDIRLRMDRRPQSVTLQPEGRTLEWAHRDGWLSLAVESVPIHSIVEIEK